MVEGWGDQALCRCSKENPTQGQGDHRPLTRRPTVSEVALWIQTVPGVRSGAPCTPAAATFALRTDLILIYICAVSSVDRYGVAEFVVRRNARVSARVSVARRESWAQTPRRLVPHRSRSGKRRLHSCANPLMPGPGPLCGPCPCPARLQPAFL